MIQIEVELSIPLCGGTIMAYSIDYLFTIYLELHANSVSICSKRAISTIKEIQGAISISRGCFWNAERCPCCQYYFFERRPLNIQFFCMVPTKIGFEIIFQLHKRKFTFIMQRVWG
jgi:hypothetical protein